MKFDIFIVNSIRTIVFIFIVIFTMKFCVGSCVRLKKAEGRIDWNVVNEYEYKDKSLNSLSDKKTFIYKNIENYTS